MTFEAFVESLSLRVSLSAVSTKQLVLGLRDELLMRVAAGEHVQLPGLGSLDSVTRRSRVCASNLPGQRKRMSVGQRTRLRFVVYPSAHAKVAKLRQHMVGGHFGDCSLKGRAVMAGKKKPRGKTVEVSVPPDVSEIVIKIEKDGKKSESKGKKRLLG